MTKIFPVHWVDVWFSWVEFFWRSDNGIVWIFFWDFLDFKTQQLCRNYFFRVKFVLYHWYNINEKVPKWLFFGKLITNFDDRYQMRIHVKFIVVSWPRDSTKSTLFMTSIFCLNYELSIFFGNSTAILRSRFKLSRKMVY